MGEKNEIKENAYKVLIKLAERKYEEEIKREEVISNKAGFLLTVISILIATIISLIGILKESGFNDITLASYFAFFVILLLISSMILAILSQFFYKKDYICKLSDLEDAINSNDNDDSYDSYGTLIGAYQDCINSRDKVNTRCTKFMLAAMILLIISIGVSLLCILVLYGRSFLL